MTFEEIICKIHLGIPFVEECPINALYYIVGQSWYGHMRYCRIKYPRTAIGAGDYAPFAEDFIEQYKLVCELEKQN